MAESNQAASKTSAAGARKSAGAARTAKGDSLGTQDGAVAPAAEKGRSARAGATKSSTTSTGKATRSTAAREGTGAARKSASAGRGAKQPDLRKDLREFASARPQGWDHDDWLAFLENLQTRGHNISDREAIGVALEKERLHIALGGLKGIGPQKRQSLVDYYGNLWQLRHADVDEIARVGNLQRKDAERIKSDLR
jgi:hypothetical protein